MRVLICGGGVIGVSIAYYLSLRGVEVVVIEPNGVANAASGKSGGFLALDWCDGGRLSELARRSFALHAELAEVVPDSGYRRLTTYGGFGGRGGRQGAGAWISNRIAIERRLGTPDTTAQIDPVHFTQGLMRLAEERGARLVPGAVSDVLRDGGRVAGVVVDGARLVGDAVVIAMGPWSILASAWLLCPPSTA
jgi:glycine/D-amino acid oxidase-like deaminating enzyme